MHPAPEDVAAVDVEAVGFILLPALGRQLVPETVAAQHEDLVIVGSEVAVVNFDGLGGAEGLEQVVLAGMVPGLLFGDFSGIDHGAHFGVIAGEATPALFLRPRVGAAVADVEDVDVLTVLVIKDHGGTAVALAPLLTGLAVDSAVRLLHEGGEVCFGFLGLQPVAQAAIPEAQGAVHGDARGESSGNMTAGAVGDDDHGGVTFAAVAAAILLVFAVAAARGDIDFPPGAMVACVETGAPLRSIVRQRAGKGSLRRKFAQVFAQQGQQFDGRQFDVHGEGEGETGKGVLSRVLRQQQESISGQKLLPTAGEDAAATGAVAAEACLARAFPRQETVAQGHGDGGGMVG